MYAQYMQAPTKEVRVSKLIRQAHRWLSIIFTTTVIANFVAMALGESPAWVVYSPLPPLFLMLVTGLYMFALPYVPKWRTERERHDEEASNPRP
jgi:cellulose synthase/poly-beta-1,6-N-acetylglucosamine synthase-like glycosyltransferase